MKKNPVAASIWKDVFLGNANLHSSWLVAADWWRLVTPQLGWRFVRGHDKPVPWHGSCANFGCYFDSLSQAKRLSGFIFSNVPFSMCTGFRWCVRLGLVLNHWGWQNDALNTDKHIGKKVHVSCLQAKTRKTYTGINMLYPYYTYAILRLQAWKWIGWICLKMWRDNPVDSIKLELVCLDLIWIYCEYHIPFEDLFACLHWVDVGPFLWQDWHPHTLWQLSTKGQGFFFAIRPKVTCVAWGFLKREGLRLTCVEDPQGPDKNNVMVYRCL